MIWVHVPTPYFSVAVCQTVLPCLASANNLCCDVDSAVVDKLPTAQCGVVQTGYIDYDKLEDKALDFRPKMLICGGSAYPREWDYKRLRQIADKVGAWLMCDMAHIRWVCMVLSDIQ